MALQRYEPSMWFEGVSAVFTAEAKTRLRMNKGPVTITQ